MATAPEVRAPPVTAEQLLGLPGDGLRHELVEGVLSLRPRRRGGGEGGDLARCRRPAGPGGRPRRSAVTVHRPDGVGVLRGDDAVLDGGDVLADLALPLRELWA